MLDYCIYLAKGSLPHERIPTWDEEPMPKERTRPKPKPKPVLKTPEATAQISAQDEGKEARGSQDSGMDTSTAPSPVVNFRVGPPSRKAKPTQPLLDGDVSMEEGEELLELSKKGKGKVKDLSGNRGTSGDLVCLRPDADLLRS